MDYLICYSSNFYKYIQRNSEVTWQNIQLVNGGALLQNQVSWLNSAFLLPCVFVPLEKRKSAHSSILTWGIPWTVYSMGSQRVRHWAAEQLSLWDTGHGRKIHLSTKTFSLSLSFSLSLTHTQTHTQGSICNTDSRHRLQEPQIWHFTQCLKYATNSVKYLWLSWKKNVWDLFQSHVGSNVRLKTMSFDNYWR